MLEEAEGKDGWKIQRRETDQRRLGFELVSGPTLEAATNGNKI